MIEQIVKKYGQHGVTAPSGWSTTPPPSSSVPTGFGQVRTSILPPSTGESCVGLLNDDVVWCVS